MALLGANLIYGGNYTIAKIVMPDFIKPFGFIVLRVLGATAFFWVLHLFMKREKIDKKDFPRLLLCSLFGVVINQLMFFKGLDLTTPINASLIMITTPILVLLISGLIMKEGITLPKVLGIMAGAFGAFLIIGGKDFSFSGETVTGDLFILINACSYALYLVTVKPLMKKYHPLTIIKWIFLMGVIPVFVVGFKQFQEIQWQTFPTHIIMATVYVVLFTTCFAYLLNISALKQVNPSVVGIYIYLQPFLASIIAVLIGQDTLTPVKVISALCIFTGVGLVSFSSFFTKKKA